MLCCAGHNCFGAVLYPITMADFTIADVTDAMLDGMCLADQLVSVFRCQCVRHLGYIAGFPNTYAEKVGKTSDALYKGVARTLHETALGLVMSLLCCSLFLGIHEHALLIDISTLYDAAVLQRANTCRG